MLQTGSACQLIQVWTRKVTSGAQSRPVAGLPGKNMSPHFVSRHTVLLQEGRGLALAALGHLQTEACEACRVALIHHPAGEMQGAISLQGRAALAASRLQSRRPKIGAFLARLLQPGSGQLLQSCLKMPKP